MGDRQPRPAEADYLVSVVGEPSDTAPEPVGATESPDNVLAAALTALAVELRLSREARADVEARLTALAGVVSLLAERSGVELPARLAPLAGEGSGR